MKEIRIGVEEFRKIREGNYYYVDKTSMLNDICKFNFAVGLFTRPRRFGKTLNMTMMREFFDIKNDSKYLFGGLDVSKNKETMKFMNQYPVIYFTLKNCKLSTWNLTYKEIKTIIIDLYIQNKNNLLFEGEREKKAYERIINESADDSDYIGSLTLLIRGLKNFYNKNVIILIDEYDAILQDAYLKNYYDEAMNFLSPFLGKVLKGNPDLHCSLITGILRITKESLFSEMNNFKLFTINEEEYNDAFGFSENEVDKILNYYSIEKQGFKQWYDGYNFGGMEIYNPWSILECVRKKGVLGVYWANTGGTKLIEDMFKKSNYKLKEYLDNLINDVPVEITIDEMITYNHMESDHNTILNFLLMTGYLTIDKVIARNNVIVRIPNEEIKENYINIIYRWFGIINYESDIDKFVRYMLVDDIESASIILNKMILADTSFHDKVEHFYHGMLYTCFRKLGDEYYVKSNREAGTGRFDLLVRKKDDSIGIIIEIKVGDLDSSKGLEQIFERRYDFELETEGVKVVNKYSMTFKDKKVCIKKM